MGKVRENGRVLGLFPNSGTVRVRYPGGESVSQSPLKDKAFSTFLDQNPPFELLAKMGFAPDKSLFS
jgi:hypothetical protein